MLGRRSAGLGLPRSALAVSSFAAWSTVSVSGGLVAVLWSCSGLGGQPFVYILRRLAALAAAAFAWTTPCRSDSNICLAPRNALTPTPRLRRRLAALPCAAAAPPARTRTRTTHTRARCVDRDRTLTVCPCLHLSCPLRVLRVGSDLWFTPRAA
jgi:hypothetical protein